MALRSVVIGAALAAAAFAASFFAMSQISGGAEPEPEREAVPSGARALRSAREEVPGLRPAAPMPALRRTREPRRRQPAAPAADTQPAAEEGVPDEPAPIPAPAPEVSPPPAPEPAPEPDPAPKPSPPPVRFFDEG
jgi:hypothetical protein